MAKTFFKDGKWTENLNAPIVHTCSCGAKYIKTRVAQNACLRCFVSAKTKTA